METPSQDPVIRFLQDEDKSLPPSDTRLGKYILKRKIARGGMGVVYEAEDPELRRSLALKILKDDDAGPETIQRLHREAAIAAQLRHPNIVGIHDVGVAQDSRGEVIHFIAMDLVEGGTLADRSGDSLEERLRILEETARAVGYAHSHGVIHRDLKPANVLVEPGGRVLLTDFGLACAEWMQTRMTRAGSIMGTPHYMAPEQVEGKSKEIDARTDVYALGVMLYEILAGRLPHNSDTPAKLYSEIVNAEPLRPSRIRPSVSRDLEVICLKAMAKDRARRYPSANEFANDLVRFRRGEPIEARPSSWAYRVRKRLAKRKASSAMGVAVILLGVSMVGWFLLDAAARKRAVEDGVEEAARLEEVGEIQAARDAYLGVLKLDEEKIQAQVGFQRMDEERKRLVVEREEQKKLAQAKLREVELYLPMEHELDRLKMKKGDTPIFHAAETVGVFDKNFPPSIRVPLKNRSVPFFSKPSATRDP